jgi:hypothetical protein
MLDGQAGDLLALVPVLSLVAVAVVLIGWAMQAIRRAQRGAAKVAVSERHAEPIRRTSEPARLFEDSRRRGSWRVEWTAPDGEIEVAIFGGPNARERAQHYADRQYGRVVEVRLVPSAL